MNAPEAGTFSQTVVGIKWAGGLRKIRWKTPGQGKSGGLRVIYYNLTENMILMVFVFRKNEAENITDEEAKMLRVITQQIKEQTTKK
ncbi:MAG: type II toxin-antitoxin system RelE/ParE family toxin [Desulfobacteraceae bacterium]|jgi:hypothetical protein